MTNIGKSVKLGVFTLAIMNVTAVVSLRGLPAEAEYGVSSAFYYLFAALVFLIPTAQPNWLPCFKTSKAESFVG